MTPELSTSGLPQPAIDELVKLYRSASARMATIVRDPWGKTPGSKLWKQGRAVELGLQVDTILRTLGANASHWTSTNLPQSIVDGIQRAQTQARAVGVDAPSLTTATAFNLIDRRAMEIIARDIVGDLHGAAAEAGDQAKRVLRATAQHDLSEADIDRAIAPGVIDGTPAAAIRNLRDQFRAVAGEKVKAGNMEFDAGYYASMVVRTKTREATTKARHGRLQELGLDLVAIIGRISVHFCTAYLGQVYSLSGSSSKYPAYSELPNGGPPFHPNCSKSTRPFVPELASDQQLDNADGDDDQGKMLNVTSTEAQRRFKDLQILQQVKANYATTADKLFAGKGK